MDTITVSAPMTVKAQGMKCDKDGIPSLTITLEATGTEVLKLIDLSDLGALIGKRTLVSIRDTQLRLATGG